MTTEERDEIKGWTDGVIARVDVLAKQSAAAIEEANRLTAHAQADYERRHDEATAKNDERNEVARALRERECAAWEGIRLNPRS